MTVSLLDIALEVHVPLNIDYPFPLETFRLGENTSRARFSPLEAVLQIYSVRPQNRFGG